MKNLVNTIHGRINQRANMLNKVLYVGQYRPEKFGETLIGQYVSQPVIFSELNVYQRRKGAKIYYN
jgi:hypothetical protein